MRTVKARFGSFFCVWRWDGYQRKAPLGTANKGRGRGLASEPRKQAPRQRQLRHRPAGHS